jgi:transposase
MKPQYVFVYLEEVTSEHCIQGEGMRGIPHEIEVYQIHHLPLVQA